MERIELAEEVRQGIEAARAGHRLLARLHFYRAVRNHPESDLCWLWLGWVCESPTRAVGCLQRALEINPENEVAHAGLTWARVMAEWDFAEPLEAESYLAALAERESTRTYEQTAPKPKSSRKPLAKTAFSPLRRLSREKELTSREALPPAPEAEKSWDFEPAAPESPIEPIEPAHPEAAEALQTDFEASFADIDVSGGRDSDVTESEEAIGDQAKPTHDQERVAEPSPEVFESESENLWNSDVEVGDRDAIVSAAEADTDPRAPSLEESTEPSEETISADWDDTERDPAAPLSQEFETVTFPEEQATGAVASDSGEAMDAVAEIEVSEIDVGGREPETASASDEPQTEESPRANADDSDYMSDSFASIEAFELDTEDSRLKESFATSADSDWETVSPMGDPQSRQAGEALRSEEEFEDVHDVPLPAPADKGSSSDIGLGEMESEDESSKVAKKTSPSFLRILRAAIGQTEDPSDEAYESKPGTKPKPPVQQEDFLETTSSDDFDLHDSTDSGVSLLMPADAEAAAGADERRVVLVVDDSPTVCKIVSLTLERRGYKVHTAKDGVDAMALVKVASPDLILLDIGMPRMDGYQLCKLLKSYPETKNIPVIMLSGKDGFFDKVRGKLVGCSEYVTKPFDPEVLVQTVERYLPVEVTA